MLLLKEPILLYKKIFRLLKSIPIKKNHPPPPGVPDINRRRLAQSRILGQVTQLDEFLADLNPEKVIRIEYVSDGMVYNVPHWADPALTSHKRKRVFSLALNNRKQKI